MMFEPIPTTDNPGPQNFILPVEYYYPSAAGELRIKSAWQWMPAASAASLGRWVLLTIMAE